MVILRPFHVQCKPGQTGDSHRTKHFDQGVGVRQGWRARPSNYIANVGFFCRTADYENHGGMYGNSANRLDSTSDTLLKKAEKAELGVYQRLGVRDDERPISRMP